jgi:hypothetical protein
MDKTSYPEELLRAGAGYSSTALQVRGLRANARRQWEQLERRSRTHPVLLQKIYEGAHLRQEQAVAQG